MAALLNNAAIVFSKTEVERRLTMEDDTRGTVVVRLVPPNASDWNSPADGARQFEGDLLTFNAGQYLRGGSKYRKELATGTSLAALSVKFVWKRWLDKRVVELITDVGNHYPRREELGYRDESKWERGLDGRPADPLQDSREILFVNPVTFETYTFCTSSFGGRRSVDELDSAMRNARRIRPDIVPLVSLESQAMPTKFGVKSRPYFRILNWSAPGAEQPAIAPPASDLDDKIPDLTK
jgi:hypothetical protein